MTDEQLQARFAQIEDYIAQQEREGKPWSGRSVYRYLACSAPARAQLRGG